jgi:hypothetical protein
VRRRKVPEPERRADQSAQPDRVQPLPRQVGALPGALQRRIRGSDVVGRGPPSVLESQASVPALRGAGLGRIRRDRIGSAGVEGGHVTTMRPPGGFCAKLASAGSARRPAARVAVSARPTADRTCRLNRRCGEREAIRLHESTAARQDASAAQLDEQAIEEISEEECGRRLDRAASSTRKPRAARPAGGPGWPADPAGRPGGASDPARWRPIGCRPSRSR